MDIELSTYEQRWMPLKLIVLLSLLFYISIYIIFSGGGLSMDLIAKVFGIGIVLCVSDMILTKSDKKDVAFWLCLAGMVVIMAIVVPQVGKLFDTVKSIFFIY